MKPPVARKLAVGHMCPLASFRLLVVSSFNYFKMFAWSVYKYAVVTAFCIYAQSGKGAAKRGVGGRALNSHGNYISDHGKSWKNHGIVFLNFCGNPESYHEYCPSLGYQRMIVHM